MTTQTSRKARRVICPRCWGILEELPNVSLYKCGGCGTTLQAKIRGGDANRAELSSQDRDILLRTQPDGVVDEKEARSVAGGDASLGSSSQETYGVVQEKESQRLNGYSARSSTIESCLEKDNISCHRKYSDGRIVSNDCSSSLGVDHGNDAIVEIERSVVDHCPSSLEVDHGDENFGKSDGKSQGGSGEWSGDASDIVISSGEVICETESDSAIQRNDVDQMEGGELLRDDDDFIDSIQHLPDLEDEEEAIFAGDSEDREVDEKRQRYSTGQGRVGDEGITSTSVRLDSGFVCNENINVFIPEQVPQPVKVDDTIVAPQRSWNESLASFYLTCPEDEQHKDHSVGKSTHRMSSMDTMASSSLAGLSSELVSKYQSMNGFVPTSNYYGSESSYDGTDDQIHERFPTRGSRNRATHSGSDTCTEVNPYMSSRLNKHHGDASRLRRPVASHKAIMSPSSYRHSLLPPRSSDNVDLLRRVYELNRKQFPNVATGTRSPAAGKFNLSHYDHNIASEVEEFGISRRQAFSDEMAQYRNRHRCSCLQHSSMQLPVRASSETEADAAAIKRRLRLKEKVKQRLLPVAGAAPLISCYKCWGLLHLPVDFLLFKRRCHSLKCNACCEVLKFSLLKGTHLVPYIPAVSDGYAPGPSSRSGSCQHGEQAISCSDHYMQSFCRSCSEEETSVISASVNQASTDSTEQVNNSKMKSVSNVTSSALSNPPLHRLMGYPSPSQVFIR